MVRWTNEALDNLEWIEIYLTQEARASRAAPIVDTLLASAERIEQFPFAHPHPPGIENPVIRNLIKGSYRLVHRTDTNPIVILSVQHTSAILRPRHLGEL